MCVIQGSVQGWVDPFFVLSNCRTVPRGGLTGDRVAPLTRGIIISARCLHRPLASGPEPSPRAGRLQRPKQLRASPHCQPPTTNSSKQQSSCSSALSTAPDWVDITKHWPWQANASRQRPTGSWRAGPPRARRKPRAAPVVLVACTRPSSSRKCAHLRVALRMLSEWPCSLSSGVPANHIMPCCVVYGLRSAQV